MHGNVDPCCGVRRGASQHITAYRIAIAAPAPCKVQTCLTIRLAAKQRRLADCAKAGAPPRGLTGSSTPAYRLPEVTAVPGVCHLSASRYFDGEHSQVRISSSPSLRLLRSSYRRLPRRSPLHNTNHNDTESTPTDTARAPRAVGFAFGKQGHRRPRARGRSRREQARRRQAEQESA